MTTRRQFLLISSLALPGCSFRPLYGKRPLGTDVTSRLAGISVEEQRSRSGQLLRNELLSTMARSNDQQEKRYQVRLDVKERESFVSSLPNEPVTRRRLVLVAKFELVDVLGGSIASRGSSQSQVAFDTVGEPVADLQARNAAMQKAAIEVAQDIRLRLAAHFSRS